MEASLKIAFTKTDYAFMCANEQQYKQQILHIERKMRLKRLGWLFISFIVILLDQITKWLVVQRVFQIAQQGGEEYISFFRWYFEEAQISDYYSIYVTSFFNIVMAWNTGVSFSMFNGMGAFGAYLLSAISLAITVIFALWLVHSKHVICKLGCALVIGGALGNVIDRVRFGAVIDFLDIHALGYHWPAFNIADISVVTGIGLLIIVSLFFDLDNKERYRDAHDEK